MKRSTVALLLRVVLALCAAATLVCVYGFLPMYLHHITDVRPELSGWYGWMIAYSTLVAIPVWIALFLLNQVFGTIASDTAFTQANARRLRRIWQLALGDIAVVAAFGLFLLVRGVTPPFLVLTFSGAIFVGLVAAIVCFALSGLCGSAAELQQERDMTV